MHQHYAFIMKLHIYQCTNYAVLSFSFEQRLAANWLWCVYVYIVFLQKL